ncbi:hypothetical protein QJQ45_012196 [Haematococcus lacustris]|nr:hypothetical protein QJQ45_012196 [Haematococcus lacustris]
MASRSCFLWLRKRRTVPKPVPEDPDDDILDRDEALQPDLTEAERNRKASGEARAARDSHNTYHGRKCKLAHLIDHLPQELWDAFLADAVQPRVEACSERAVLASLLLGLLVRGLFTIYIADPLGLHGQPVYTDILVSQAAIPDLSCRNLFLQLCRGLPGNGANTQPNAAVAAVLAAHPDLRARLAAIPRYLLDSNMVDHVGKQLETAFSNMLTLLFAGRLKKSVSLAGAKVLVGTEEHRRRFGFWGLAAGVRRMVCGLDVSWLLEEGGVVQSAAMEAEVALQRGLLGLEEGELVDHDWVENPANRGRLLRHAVHTTREMEAAMAAWQLDMVPWQQAELTNPGLLPRPPRPPTPYAITPSSKCRVRHVFIDTRDLYGMMRDAGMLGVLTEAGVTSMTKFRNGALPDPAEPGKYIEGLKDSHCIEVSARSILKDRLGKTEGCCAVAYCKRAVTPGKTQCPQCFFKRRARNERANAKKTLAQQAWEQHKRKAKWRFTALMFPEGPNGPQATCEELVPDLENPDGPLKRCGGIGTVNRLKSGIRSYCDINQRCSVLCHVHNMKDESRQNTELATTALAAQAALAAETALAAKKGAAKKGAAKKGAAKKGAGSKECPIVID